MAVLAGVYRHYKGPLYLVMGLAHDANAGELYTAEDVEDAARAWQSGVMHELSPIGDRDLVLYIGLELDDAHTGPRLAVRSYDDFFADVHMGNPERFTEGTVCADSCKYNRLNGIGIKSSDEHKVVPRFTYLGPTWEGQR